MHTIDGPGAWRAARIAAPLAGLSVVAALLAAPRLGLHLLWDVLIPAAPLLLILAPGLWRNICPLAATALLPQRLGFSLRRTLPPRGHDLLHLSAVLLLYAVVPLRHAVLNVEASAAAGLLAAAAAAAVVMGLLFEKKSGWCSTLCPIQPVERLYGFRPLSSPPNAHCDDCTRCTGVCPESTPGMSPWVGRPRGIRALASALLVGGFPGFIAGWFQVPDARPGLPGAGLSGLYVPPLAGLFLSLAVYLLARRAVPPRAHPLLGRAFAAAAAAVYYGYRLPALVGFPPFPGDGVLVDLRPVLPEAFPWLLRAASTLLLAAWMLPRAGRRSWTRRPPFASRARTADAPTPSDLAAIARLPGDGVAPARPIGAAARRTSLAVLLLALSAEAGQDASGPAPHALPRWRGFNLLEKFTLRGDKPYVEDDFRWIRELGFDFVRLPLDYRIWIRDGDPRKIDESALAGIDQAVEYGRRHGLHVSLNFHRAPGYCVNPPPESGDLWTDPDVLEVAARHWAVFARRYKGVPNARLSFDLLNEPKKVDGPAYFKVARRLVEAIRREDPDRLILADGSSWGTVPVPELVPLRVAQSTRGYQPFGLSHYRASWVAGSDRWPVPTWPVRERPDGGQPQIVYDRARLLREQIAPWKALEARGVGIHVGEWGAFRHTPHDVTLAWMEDCLRTWKEAGWGWALWNFRGPFGILDSGRADVAYEDWRGHTLDRKMLELLQKY